MTLLVAVLLCGCAGGSRRSAPTQEDAVAGDLATEAAPRATRPADIALPSGYRIEKVASGLTFPSAVVFDDRDRAYVVEAGYSRGESWAVPRLLRLEPDDRFTVIASGDRNGPWTGATYYKGSFYVAEGGELDGGRILRIDPDTGRSTALVEGLPSTGDHPTTGPVIGPDGRLYFGQGTMTNSGVVGADDDSLGWLSRYPDRHDVPCRDVTLKGLNFSTPKGPTGAFMPIGTASHAGQVVKGQLPCSGAIMSVAIDGPPSPALVAWGLRSPAGLAFSPKGRLFVTDDGYAERGSRPVWGGADVFWSISTGTWYGWPDYSGDRPLSDAEFASGGSGPGAVLASAPGKPPKPSALFGVHASAGSFDFSRGDSFGHVGEAFVAEFGDQAPFDGRVAGAVGFKVVRVDPQTGLIEDFAVNRGRVNGPASRLKTGGFERPIAARFSPDGLSLYVVDFGRVDFTPDGAQPVKGTGVVWRITREE